MNAGNTARFQSVTDDDLQDFVVKQKNKSTVNKTFYDLKLLSSYLHRVNEMHEISEIPQNELYNLLCKFFVCVKKPDGSSYEPTTLRGFLGSVQTLSVYEISRLHYIRLYSTGSYIFLSGNSLIQ
ncbi:hypothetical protein MAR_032965 [Mya arenaria]|uniref:Integrase SAM-like N-terminal domain-containing protein n=1 Tax=Mya arenaria TaxID=6604 RepID=A0ABY7G7N4_MYAAR|nr:hypothetical protein MAR_032960 [Mya arenaria]WAR30423.1 hypothetical protein MAR_032965 [Mya arenaria]